MKTATVPEGNYDAQELCAAIQAQLDAETVIGAQKRMLYGTGVQAGWSCVYAAAAGTAPPTFTLKNTPAIAADAIASLGKINFFQFHARVQQHA